MRGWLYWRRKMLVVAEREAQIEAYMDLARPIYQLLHQLVPMNEKLGRAQIAHYLPPLYLPDWNSERLAAWTREYLAVAEPKEWSRKAVQLALAREQDRLTKRQIREYRQAIGDHDHLGLQ